MNGEKCVQCGACAQKCKASCMDVANTTVDFSRCVMCLDCLSVCPADAVEFSPRSFTGSAHTNQDRRAFLLMAGLLVTGLPRGAWAEPAGGYPGLNAGAAGEGKALAPAKPPLGPPRAIIREASLVPPGGLSREHFISACTGCHLCVAACPSQIIRPGLLLHQGKGLLTPALSYDKGFCNYNCNACTQVCPSGAILPVDAEEKKRIQMGKARFIEENCVAAVKGTECVACAEHCPTGAVKIVRKPEGPGLPKVDAEVCVGCGACEFACPARPFKAIYVEAELVHGRALPPKKGESAQNMVGEDFPF